MPVSAFGINYQRQKNSFKFDVEFHDNSDEESSIKKHKNYDKRLNEIYYIKEYQS